MSRALMCQKGRGERWREEGGEMERKGGIEERWGEGERDGERRERRKHGGEKCGEMEREGKRWREGVYTVSSQAALYQTTLIS